MALVKHMSQHQPFDFSHFRINQFVENQKQAVRVNRAGIEIIITIFGIIEVKAAKFSGANEAGDDHFNVHVGRMVAKVNKAKRLRPKLLSDHQTGAPVLHHCRIESRFIHFMFRKYPPVFRQCSGDLFH